MEAIGPYSPLGSRQSMPHSGAPTGHPAVYPNVDMTPPPTGTVNNGNGMEGQQPAMASEKKREEKLGAPNAYTLSGASSYIKDRVPAHRRLRFFWMVGLLLAFVWYTPTSCLFCYVMYGNLFC
jgi:hypothetical protein